VPNNGHVDVLFITCFALNLEQQKCEKDIKQDISWNGNNI